MCSADKIRGGAKPAQGSAEAGNESERHYRIQQGLKYTRKLEHSRPQQLNSLGRTICSPRADIVSAGLELYLMSSKDR